MQVQPATPVPASTRRLRLADHVRACHVDGQVVLLDLRRSRYLAVRAMPSLAQDVAGWPTHPRVDVHLASAAESPDAILRITASLLAQGLLTSHGDSKPPSGPVLPAPTRSINAEHSDETAPVGWRRVVRFGTAAGLSAMRLRCQSLSSIADAVGRGRAHRSGSADAHTLDAASAAVAAYQRMRLFGFSSHDRCLRDSLTLVAFLAGEGIAAYWVIGVRTRPFGAHAWAQIDDVVLNDQHEQVRRYTPILVA